MSTRTIVGVAFAAGVGAALIGIAAFTVGPAEAHIVTTELADAGEIVNMMFYPNVDLPDAGSALVTDICGRTKYDDGGYTDTKCYRATITSGAVFNGINNLAANQALDLWLQKRGLK